jgi:hypothetical protein
MTTQTHIHAPFASTKTTNDACISRQYTYNTFTRAWNVPCRWLAAMITNLDPANFAWSWRQIECLAVVGYALGVQNGYCARMCMYVCMYVCICMRIRMLSAHVWDMCGSLHTHARAGTAIHTHKHMYTHTWNQAWRRKVRKVHERLTDRRLSGLEKEIFTSMYTRYMWGLCIGLEKEIFTSMCSKYM